MTVRKFRGSSVATLFIVFLYQTRVKGESQELLYTKKSERVPNNQYKLQVVLSIKSYDSSLNHTIQDRTETN